MLCFVQSNLRRTKTALHQFFNDFVLTNKNEPILQTVDVRNIVQIKDFFNYAEEEQPEEKTTHEAKETSKNKLETLDCLRVSQIRNLVRAQHQLKIEQNLKFQKWNKEKKQVLLGQKLQKHQLNQCTSDLESLRRAQKNTETKVQNSYTKLAMDVAVMAKKQERQEKINFQQSEVNKINFDNFVKIDRNSFEQDKINGEAGNAISGLEEEVRYIHDTLVSIQRDQNEIHHTSKHILENQGRSRETETNLVREVKLLMIEKASKVNKWLSFSFFGFMGQKETKKEIKMLKRKIEVLEKRVFELEYEKLNENSSEFDSTSIDLDSDSTEEKT